IMVLELKVPHGDSFDALGEVTPIFLSYVLSFIYVGIYWNNHHHLLHLAHKVTGAILWANLHLLFWLSLIPFATAWMGESHFATVPTALYGVSLMMPALAWLVLQGAILRAHGPDSLLAKALGRDVKGKVSFLLYFVAIPMAFFYRWLAEALYVFVA